MDTDTPRVDACANGDLSIYPLARQLEREMTTGTPATADGLDAAGSPPIEE